MTGRPDLDECFSVLVTDENLDDRPRVRDRQRGEVLSARASIVSHCRWCREQSLSPGRYLTLEARVAGCETRACWLWPHRCGVPERDLDRAEWLRHSLEI